MDDTPQQNLKSLHHLRAGENPSKRKKRVNLGLW